MCTEPETMVPIVNSRAQQVVLVGDHKQLQPIVLEETAKDLGLFRSLFERYKDKARMLTMQYRMVIILYVNHLGGFRLGAIKELAIFSRKFFKV